jgi:hypothetical protein
VNILFNFLTRQRDAGFSILNVLGFLGISLVFLGPLAWSLLALRIDGRFSFSHMRQRWRETGLIAFAVAFVVPQVIMFVVSFTHRIGPHWILSFYPFLFAALPGMFNAEVLRIVTRQMIVYGSLFAVILTCIVLLPVELFRQHASYDSIILATHPHQVIAKLREIDPQCLIATPSYAKSAMLSFYHDSYVPVLGDGSSHGRQDDFITDVRDLDGRDILIITNKSRQRRNTRLWFEQAESRDLEVRGAQFEVVVGRGFKYDAYRASVLRYVAQKYYDVPDWLAKWSPPSFFKERYGFRPATRPSE